MKRVLVVGGGASGLLAAATAAQYGAKVTLLEKNSLAGAKIRISGKGRCNLTNTCPPEEFLAAYGPNGHFLQGAFSRFFRDDLLTLLESLDIPTKVERGGRVFPQSDSADEVAEALIKHAKQNGVSIAYNCPVRQILHENGEVCGVKVDSGALKAEAVILACGGASFPHTGSSGDGYTLAKDCGHTILPLLPALVPLAISEKDQAILAQGTSLKNVRLSLYACGIEKIPTSGPTQNFGRGILGKKAKEPLLESRMGEMMITHFGLGGPITLQTSLAAALALRRKSQVWAVIDLKPALALAELNRRIQKEIESHPQRSLDNLLKELIPLKLRALICLRNNLNPFMHSCDINKEQRQALAVSLKNLAFEIVSTLPLSVAMITAGGISLNEVDPKTMASKKLRGLFLSGEILDIDAETGGFNLQAAFSTGYVAGWAAATK